MHEYMRKEDRNAFGYRKQLVDCSSESFVEESAGHPFKKKKSDILPKFNQEKEFLDDSFKSSELEKTSDTQCAFICPPTNAFHKYFQRRTWVCWYHTQASVDDHEVQLQRVNVVTDTPQNQKPMDVPLNAPSKAATDPHTRTDKSGKRTKVNLAENLNAESSDEEFKDKDLNSEDLKTDEDSVSDEEM